VSCWWNLFANAAYHESHSRCFVKRQCRLFIRDYINDGDRPLTPDRVSKFALLFIIGAVVSLGVGCQPKPAAAPSKPANQAAEDNRSIYRQAIDQAKSLEKRINDRAIDPEEKAQLDSQTPGGQDQ